VAYSFYKQIKQ